MAFPPLRTLSPSRLLVIAVSATLLLIVCIAGVHLAREGKVGRAFNRTSGRLVKKAMMRSDRVAIAGAVGVAGVWLAVGISAGVQRWRERNA